MTHTRALQLRSGVIVELENILNARPYQELFICMGRDYLQAISGYEAILPNSINVRIAFGSLGRKLGELHDWLHGKPPELPQSPLKSIQQDKKLKFRGVEVTLTSKQVLDVAYQALETDKQELTRFQSWYVPVGTNRVAPKWLVSQLTGLSVSEFTTKEALRLLVQLGIEVKRV